MSTDRYCTPDFATPVTVTLSGKHGKMVVEFADLEDLERIYRLMTEGPASED